MVSAVFFCKDKSASARLATYMLDWAAER